jgi:hypothetical protein
MVGTRGLEGSGRVQSVERAAVGQQFGQHSVGCITAVPILRLTRSRHPYLRLSFHFLSNRLRTLAGSIGLGTA